MGNQQPNKIKNIYEQFGIKEVVTMVIPYTIEEWREVTFPGIGKGRYLVSSTGKVFSIRRNCMLVPYLINSGYYCVNLVGEDGILYNTLIHRLVAWEFCNHPDDITNYIVNHKNGIKTSNFDVNLEWCTQEENMKHAFANNLVGKQSKRLIDDETARKIGLYLQDGLHYEEILKRLNLPVTKQMKALCDNIKNRHSYIKACEDLNLENHNGKSYNNETIHRICEMIAKNVPIADICETIEGREYKGSRKDKHFYEYIRMIKNKQTFKEISDLYF